MKISFFAPHLKVAGGTRIFLRYAALLSLRGHTVTVYVVEKNFLRRLLMNMSLMGVPHWAGNLGSVRFRRVSGFTDSTIDDGDIVIATNYKTAHSISGLSPRKGEQVYLIQHDEGLYHGARDEVDRAYRLPQHKVVIATWLQELLREKYQRDSALVLNPIDTRQFFEVPGRRENGVVRIMLLAHSYDWKGTKEGVEMVNRLKQKYPQIRLVLFGVREKQVEQYQYDEYHFDPAQEKLREIYSRADIYLCPSWDEGYGLPSVEAMACGAALVTYDNGGSRDYAFHEKTALVARHKDMEDLTRQLERMVTDTALRSDIAQRGKEYVQAMPGWEERTTELEKVLSEIARNSV